MPVSFGWGILSSRTHASLNSNSTRRRTDDGAGGIIPVAKASSKTAKRIAIVEDVQELVNLYSTALKLHGHEIVFTADSGEKAVELTRNAEFREAQVDVVIVDYRLQGMDGIETSKNILMRSPKARIIIVSADRSAEEEARARGYIFVRKPFSIAELLDAIV